MRDADWTTWKRGVAMGVALWGGFRSGRFLPNLFAGVGRSRGGVRGQVGGASVDDRCQMQGWTREESLPLCAVQAGSPHLPVCHHSDSPSCLCPADLKDLLVIFAQRLRLARWPFLLFLLSFCLVNPAHSLSSSGTLSWGPGRKIQRTRLLFCL